MKKRGLALLFAVMTLCSMSLIFYNSSMTSEESADLSKTITRFLIDFFQKNDADAVSDEERPSIAVGASQTENKEENVTQSNTKSDAEKDKEVARLNTPIRKAAHAVEFIPLGFSLCGLLYCLLLQNSLRKNSLFALICGIFYAATDEFHQLFVDGRGCQAKDVVVDTLGVMLGVLFFMCMANVCKPLRRSKG